MKKMKRNKDSNIQTADELEFAIFCIENLADQLKMDAETVFDLLTVKSDVLYQYIVPEFELLHTQSKKYIVDELIEVLREKGVNI